MFSEVDMFPAYLQGMERVWLYVLSDHGNLVPSLPTRNGKLAHCLRYHLDGFVPSLPTRNGKGGRTTRLGPVPPGSQPTYKEWKEALTKEWWNPSDRSQPTYKEWKENHHFASVFGTRGFPAYLQGMESPAPACKPDGHGPVPSLPTRNGKGSVRFWAWYPAQAFPAYLQGMEIGTD